MEHPANEPAEQLRPRPPGGRTCAPAAPQTGTPDATTGRPVAADLSVVTMRWSAITIDCSDANLLGAFWSGLLGLEPRESLPGWVKLGDRSSSSALPLINFQPVPEPKRDKTRIHLDLSVADINAAAATVTRLGGRSLDERHDYDEGVVMVMADPEGNEFCIVQYY